jgi:hypothetical protein
MNVFTIKHTEKAILFVGLLFLFAACLQEKLIFYPIKYRENYTYNFTLKVLRIRV